MLVYFDAAHAQPLTTDRSHSRPTLHLWPLLKRMQAEPVRDQEVALAQTWTCLEATLKP